MKAEDSISYNKQIYYRLIALWVLCESVIGGIIHGFKLPFSGLIVGSSAVICICLIAHYYPIKGAILKATIIVAIFKMMLSPQAPPTAYIAVFFQGAVGQLLFYNLRYYKLSCMLLGMLALVESALQRIIVLILIYGTAFWKAVNNFFNNLIGEKQTGNYSLLIAAGYILFHVFFGLMIGAFAFKLVKWSVNRNELKNKFLIESAEKNISETRHGAKKGVKKIFLFIWIILIILFFQSWLHIGKSLIPAQVSLRIFLRSVLIILTWYFLINPLVLKGLKSWLEKRRKTAAIDIDRVMLLLPSTHYILTKGWQLSASKTGLNRLKEYCKIVLVNTLK